MKQYTAYSFPPVPVKAKNVWPGDLMPLVTTLGHDRGPVSGLYFHNSHPDQPVSVVFEDGSHLSFKPDETVHVSHPRR